MDLPMTRSLTALLAALMLLSACGTRLNPFNWFGRSQPVETVAVVDPKADPRALIETVESMSVESYSGGAIVRATGITPSQGYWDAELVEVPDQPDGQLLLEFRVFPPVTPTQANTPRSREITAAITLSPAKLEYISKITVQGASNARSSGR
jgi:hypothetical protein